MLNMNGALMRNGKAIALLSSPAHAWWREEHLCPLTEYLDIHMYYFFQDFWTSSIIFIISCPLLANICIVVAYITETDREF